MESHETNITCPKCGKKDIIRVDYQITEGASLITGFKDECNNCGAYRYDGGGLWFEV